MFKKVSGGERLRIPHADYNAMIDAAKAHLFTKNGALPDDVPPDSLDGVILVKNTLTRGLPRGSILGLNGSIANPNYDAQQRLEFINSVALKGELPSSTTSGRFCVLQTDASAGEIVPAMVSGVTLVRLSVTATTDSFAEVDTAAADPTKWLKTGSSGSAQILYVYEQTGEQWGVVRLSNRPIVSSLVRFELTSPLSLGSNASAKLLQPSAIGTGIWEAVTPQVDIRVYDAYDPDGMWAAPSGSWGLATPREQEYSAGVAAYDIVWMEQSAGAIQFTSLQHMGATFANQMNVTVNWYDHQGINPGETIYVRDPQGQFPDVHQGAKGTAIYDYHSGYYRVVSCQRVAKLATITLNAPYLPGEDPTDFTDFAVIPVGNNVGAPPTTPTTVSNPRHAGITGNTFVLVRINNTMPNPSWMVIDATKHLFEHFFDFQVNEANKTLEFKREKFYAEKGHEETPDWEEYYGPGTDCGETP
jgi:hypothetical protein